MATVAKWLLLHPMSLAAATEVSLGEVHSLPLGKAPDPGMELLSTDYFASGESSSPFQAA